MHAEIKQLGFPRQGHARNDACVSEQQFLLKVQNESTEVLDEFTYIHVNSDEYVLKISEVHCVNPKEDTDVSTCHVV